MISISTWPQAVLATATTTAAAEIVDELVAHSMLEVVRGGRVRYRLLGPVGNGYRKRSCVTSRWPATTSSSTSSIVLSPPTSSSDRRAVAPSWPCSMSSSTTFAARTSGRRESNRVGDDVRFYRPLAFGRWHGQFEPGRWAVEALATPGIEQHKGWGAVIAVAVYSAYTQLDRSLRDRIRDRPPRSRMTTLQATWSRRPRSTGSDTSMGIGERRPL